MKTQDDVDVQAAPTPSSPRHSKGRRWLTGLIVLLVIVLVVGASAVVFAQFTARQGQAPSGNGTGTGTGAIAPPAGRWASVLSGYEISSLVAAQSNPAVLYLCATPRKSSGSSVTIKYTILRSSDFGTHWQDVGSKAGLGNTCQVAVNPANSNDVYVMAAPAVEGKASIAAPYMLWHSLDGWQTWTVILPTLHAPAPLTSTAWQVQQIHIEGGKLYGIQAFPASPSTPGQRSTRPIPARLPETRLVMSVDDGHTWTVVDSQFIQSNQGVRDYAIDPTNTRTMYELVGTSFLAPGMESPTHMEPAYSYNVSLYKTADGGVTWHLLLGNLLFSSQLRLAIGNPQVLYIGGAVGPIPYAAEAPTASSVYSTAFGLFQLRVSTDGGATWKMVTDTKQVLWVRGWFVSPDGRAFLATAGEGSILPSGQSTAVAGTVVPAQPQSTSNGSIAVQSRAVAQVPAITTPPAYPLIKSYDPASGAWSTATTAPTSGILFALTPSGANSGAVLWLLGSNNVSSVLLRYVA